MPIFKATRKFNKISVLFPQSVQLCSVEARIGGKFVDFLRTSYNTDMTEYTTDMTEKQYDNSDLFLMYHAIPDW